MADRLLRKSFDPDAYRRHHRVGFSFRADCWCNADEGRPFDVEHVENNRYAPLEMTFRPPPRGGAFRAATEGTPRTAHPGDPSISARSASSTGSIRRK